MMAKCYQCDNPAMYTVGEQKIPLCLNCYEKCKRISQAQIENDERMMNFLLDQANSIVGLPVSGPRFPPRPNPVQVLGAKLNNIIISNSVIGTVNTGYINTVDNCISVLSQSGEETLADAIKKISDAILQSKELNPTQKNELMEDMSVISEEAIKPKEDRKTSVVRALIAHASQITSLANDITDLCQKWWLIVTAAFVAAKTMS